MDFFDVLTMVGGLALFLYGMQVLGDGLSKASGGRMERILEKLTSSRLKAVLLGAAVTAVIQSSSAAIMKLPQAIGVIMGANIGTTVTSWILSLSGIESGNFWIRLLKPSSFAPVLAITGVGIFMFSERGKKKNLAQIFVGFAVLMFGMETMSGAVKPLADVPEVKNLFVLFSNPVPGLLAGIFLTALLQSSSASIGILQALCAAGAISYGSAVPIIMGQNIGTCVTALLSSVGTSPNAKRAAFIHLYFNVIGTAVFMTLFYVLHAAVDFPFMEQPAEAYGIAVVHSVFNIFAACFLLPFGDGLEKLAYLTIRKDASENRKIRHVEADAKILDSRFLDKPSFAMEQCRRVASHMAVTAKEAYMRTLDLLHQFDGEKAEEISGLEEDTDRYEDMIGTYLLKLSGQKLSEKDGRTLMLFLESIGDFERISDHAAGIMEAYREMWDKEKKFSNKARVELDIFARAVANMMEMTLEVFDREDVMLAFQIQPLFQVISELGAEVRTRHIRRLRKGKCTIEMGFLLADIVTGCERIAAHCSHIAVSVIEVQEESLEIHGFMSALRGNESEEQKQLYQGFKGKYVLP